MYVSNIYTGIHICTVCMYVTYLYLADIHVCMYVTHLYWHAYMYLCQQNLYWHTFMYVCMSHINTGIHLCMYVYIYWPIYIYCHICPLTYKTFPYKQIWTGDIQAQPVFFSVFKGKKLMQINIVETKIKFLVRFNFVYKQSAQSPASYWIFDI